MDNFFAGSLWQEFLIHPLCISLREFMNCPEMIGKIVCVHVGIWGSVPGFYQNFSDLHPRPPR